MTLDERAALEAFQHLGLTSYEAQVFVGLHRLGMGTAREVANVTDVPRSQVYSVADSLEERGLVEVQQANPRRFRPVSVERAREMLRETFEAQQSQALDYVEAVSEESEGHEEQEAVWNIHGTQRITRRMIDLLEAANERVIVGLSDPRYLSDELISAVRERADAGLAVYLITTDASVEAAFEDHPDIEVHPPRPHREDQHASRALFIDDDGLLVAVTDPDGEETAIWSAGSQLASVFIQLVDAPGDRRGDR